MKGHKFNSLFVTTMLILSILFSSAAAYTSPNQPPVAYFTYAPADIYPGDTVHFDASPSWDPESGIDHFEWDLNGDGVYEISGIDKKQNQVYNEIGDVIVKLKVVDDLGATSVYTKKITVKTPGVTENLPPVSYFTYAPSDVYAGDTVHFDASESYDPESGIDHLEWDYNGDGTADEVTNFKFVSHVFSEVKDYTVKLTVYDDLGAKATYTKVISVKQPGTQVNQPPVAFFEVSPDSPLLIGDTVHFDASQSYDPESGLVSLEWDFNGDGVFDETTQAKTTNNQYNEVGNFKVTLKVTDDIGATAEYFRYVSILNPSVDPSENVTISNVQVTEITSNSAKISYDVDVGAFTLVEYGTTAALGYQSTSIQNIDGVKQVFNMIGLDPKTTYYYRIVAGKDLAQMDVFSPVSQFTTLEDPIVNPPGTNNAPTITIQRPTANEQIIPGTFNVIWSASDVDGDAVTIDLAYRSDSGTFVPIQSNLVNTGSYVWNVNMVSGNYILKATAKDGKTTTSKEVSFKVVPPGTGGGDGTAPVAILRASTQFGQAPVLVQLDGTQSTDDGSIVKYEFKKDATSNFETDLDGKLSYTYDTVGNYVVELRVTDDEGNTDTDSLTIQVVGEQGPTIRMLTPRDGDVIKGISSFTYEMLNVEDFDLWVLYLEQRKAGSNDEFEQIDAKEWFSPNRLDFDTYNLQDGNYEFRFALDLAKFEDLDKNGQITEDEIVVTSVFSNSPNVKIDNYADDNNEENEEPTKTLDDYDDSTLRLVGLNFPGPNGEFVRPGEMLEVSITLKNDADLNMDVMNVGATIQELGTFVEVGPFEIEEGDTMTKNLFLEIPMDAEVGDDYLVRVDVSDSNGQIQRTFHRFVTVV